MTWFKIWALIARYLILLARGVKIYGGGRGMSSLVTRRCEMDNPVVAKIGKGHANGKEIIRSPPQKMQNEGERVGGISWFLGIRGFFLLKRRNFIL